MKIKRVSTEQQLKHGRSTVTDSRYFTTKTLYIYSKTDFKVQ